MSQMTSSSSWNSMFSSRILHKFKLELYVSERMGDFFPKNPNVSLYNLFRAVNEEKPIWYALPLPDPAEEFIRTLLRGEKTDSVTDAREDMQSKESVQPEYDIKDFIILNSACGEHFLKSITMALTSLTGVKAPPMSANTRIQDWLEMWVHRVNDAAPILPILGQGHRKAVEGIRQLNHAARSSDVLCIFTLALIFRRNSVRNIDSLLREAVKKLPQCPVKTVEESQIIKEQYLDVSEMISQEFRSQLGKDGRGTKRSRNRNRSKSNFKLGSVFNHTQADIHPSQEESKTGYS